MPINKVQNKFFPKPVCLIDFAMPFNAALASVIVINVKKTYRHIAQDQVLCKPDRFLQIVVN